MTVCIGMAHEHHNTGQGAFGRIHGWVDSSYAKHQSIHEYGGIEFGSPVTHNLLSEAALVPRISSPSTQKCQQLLPLIMPSYPTWPSMLTNPAGYQALPMAIPPASPAPVKKAKLPAIHAPARKPLTDEDRRRICQYHDENPSVKQKEIGAIFGVERSTVSKVLKQKEKYLSPVERAKGKFPDIDRALANWVRKSWKQGHTLTDAVIEEKAQFFAATVGNSDSQLKANSTRWLEKFKQKNGIGGGKLLRRASETNISDRGLLNRDPAVGSIGSPGAMTSPSSLSSSQSKENMMAAGLDDFLKFDHGHGYCHSSPQSITSHSSALTDTTPSSFPYGPTSPANPLSSSPDAACPPVMPSQHSSLSYPATNTTNFQHHRSQTFPNLNIDASHTSGLTLEDDSSQSATAPSSALDAHSISPCPIHELPPNFRIGTTSSPSLAMRCLSSNSSVPPFTTTPSSLASSLSSWTSPPSGPSDLGGLRPSLPTQDDARRTLYTILTFLTSSPPDFVDQSDYMALLQLIEKVTT